MYLYFWALGSFGIVWPAIAMASQVFVELRKSKEPSFKQADLTNTDEKVHPLRFLARFVTRFLARVLART